MLNGWKRVKKGNVHLGIDLLLVGSSTLKCLSYSFREYFIISLDL